jgi:bifunctional DNase/RNase
MEIEMTVKTLIPDPLNSLPIVVLQDRTGERILPIWIGLPEANAILLQIDKVETPRPMTHDLLKNILEDLKARVSRIVVCDLRDNTFYANIYLDTQGGAVTIDARPSDAIALALRTRSPIFVEDVVIQNARSIDSKDSMDVSRLRKWLEDLSDDELGKYKM